MEKPAGTIATKRLLASGAESIAQAAEILRNGGLVAMPTETVYGLAANALDPAAVERIFTAKERPHWDPLIVHISSLAMLPRVAAELSPAARILGDAFWPGPLTLLLPRASGLPPSVTAGRDLVGVRIPEHPIALQLILQSGLPLAAPSANRFGHTSPTTAEHVLADLDGRIEAVLDGGPCAVGVESTVFDPVANLIYRQGGISQAQIERALGHPVDVYRPPAQAGEPQSLPSPGVGIRHYAPNARVLLVEDEASMRREIAALDAGFVVSSTGIMLPQEWSVPGFRGATFVWESWSDPTALARTLYAGLRELDARGVDVILCPIPPAGSEPLVEAIRDRLHKAAKVS